jgi:hypothetical protein
MQLELNSFDREVVNNFNYAVGLKGSVYSKYLRFDAGITYVTKNYSKVYSRELAPYYQSDHRLHYIMVPFTLNTKAFTDTLNTISIVAGADIINAFGYNYTVSNKDGTSDQYNNLKVHYKPGTQLRIGVGYSRRVAKRFLLFAELTGSYKVILDYDESAPKEFDVRDLTDDRISLILHLGIEILLGKKKIKYYFPRLRSSGVRPAFGE